MGPINQDTGVVTYTPSQDFIGNDSFNFKVNDGKADSSNVGTVNIKVNGTTAGLPSSSTSTSTSNSTSTNALTSSSSSSGAPVATSQSIRTNQDAPVDITLSGTDPNQNATLTAHIISPPLHGKLSTINQGTGRVTYTPNPGFTGSDGFTFKIYDGKFDSINTGILSIIVGAS